MRRLALAVVAACALAGCTHVPAPPPLPPVVKPIFARSAVRLLVKTRLEVGGQANVHFVIATPGVDLRRAAQECVDDYTQPGQYRAAYCYAYTSVADFTFAHINEKTGDARHLCWRASAARGVDGSVGGDNNPSYPKQKCPGAKTS